MQCTGVSNSRQYRDVPRHPVSLADQFIEQDDNDDDNAHYYSCPRYLPFVPVRKSAEQPAVSRENKHFLVHYASSIKDTLGIPYLLYCSFLI